MAAVRRPAACASASIQAATGGVSVICDSVTTSRKYGPPSASASAQRALDVGGIDHLPGPQAESTRDRGVVDRVEIDAEK